MHIAEEEEETKTECGKERRIINVAIRNFFKPFQMHCTFTGTLGIFCPSFRQWKQIHITLSQVNTASSEAIG
jgi:hypothetical protein